MQKLTKILLSASIFITLFTTYSFADLWWFEIENYDTTIRLEEDWNMKVKEIITVNFLEPRHGIFRDIPTTYDIDNTFFQIFVSSGYVSGYQYSATEWYDNYSFKIWSPDYTVEWKQKYIIEYNVYWWVRKFSWYQELYRNLIWTDRDTNIKNSSFNIIFPKEYNITNPEDVFLYHWRYWENMIDKVNYETTNQWINGKIIDKLDPYESLTIWVKFQSWFFNLDNDRQASLLLYGENYKYIPMFGWLHAPINNEPSIILLIISIIIFGLIILRIKKRNYTKNIRQKKLLTVYYTPPKWIKPSEAGVLIDDKLDAHDITSMIYERASKWYINIEEKKGKSFLGKTNYLVNKKIKSIPEDEPEYQKHLFNKMFSWKDQFSFSNQSTFTSYVKSSLDKLEEYLLSQELYTIKSIKNKPSRALWNRLILIFFGWIIGPTIFLISSAALSASYWLSLSSWFLILFFVWQIYMFFWMFFLPRQEILTEKWVQLRYELLWLKKFLAKVEEKRLKTFLKQDPLYFEKILPFAIVFWLQSKFIKKITPLLKELPEWYQGDPLLFSSSILSTINNINTASYYVPPSTYSSYSSSNWFSSGSSFSSWWSSWGGWWGGGWWSW